MNLDKIKKITSIILVLIIFTVLYFKYTPFIEGWKLENRITLFAVLITIFSTLYYNYMSDERVKKQLDASEKQFKEQLLNNEKDLKKQLLIDKQHDCYENLYNDLNEFWSYVDIERINYYIDKFQDVPEPEIDNTTFGKIHKIILDYKFSPNFNYMSLEIQNIMNNFIKYIDNHLEHYDYYNYTQDTYLNALDILSELYPLLKKEIGITN